MHRKTLIIITICIFLGVINAQTYKPFDLKNMQWDVTLCTNLGFSTNAPHLQYDNVTYNICSDSVIINNIRYKPIYFKKHTYTNFPPITNYTTPYSLYGYLRQDSILKRTYLRLINWNVDSLLMDYNLSVGDTVKRGFYFYSKQNSSSCYTSWDIKKIKVQNIGYNIMAKCFYTDTANSSAYFIEGAGHSFGIFKSPGTFYETYCAPFENCNDLQYIQNSTNCLSLVNSVYELDITKPSLKIYPNPIENGNFTLTSDQEFNCYQIVDITGRIIESKKFTSKTTIEINSDKLNSGYYFVSTNLNGNSRSVLKVIVIR